MKLFCLLFILTSCAKLSYITKQGLGQISLEYNGIKNDKLLSDDNIKQSYKEKIRLIEKAKRYFYKYFNLPETDIYDETTILKNRAVTYLVIHSPKDKIKAIETSFPIVGSFPYLGFFNQEDALEYKKDLEREGYSTYLREVYAYSTLNQWLFDDNILSSFFIFNDHDLVELIFHELTHTILFVKNDVEFNENLAQFVSEELLSEYFHYSKEELKKIKVNQQNSNELIKIISLYSKELNSQYIDSKDFESTLNNFLQNTFHPSIEKKCIELKIEKCWPLRDDWNNARFAAFSTYESKRDELREIYKSTKKNLNTFIYDIIKINKKHNSNKRFIETLKKEL